ncbi:MAG TPA: hypothetical protein VFT15_03510 [Chitinophagaceae bacterium]|nr:hypothetical protein [Chitinophagaceae bacterium]
MYIASHLLLAIPVYNCDTPALVNRIVEDKRLPNDRQGASQEKINSSKEAGKPKNYLCNPTNSENNRLSNITPKEDREKLK